MKKRRRTKKLTKKQLRARNQLYKNTAISALLCLLVLGISYIIFRTDILQPRINRVTASYISFYNNDTTDVIKINDIKKMSDDIGKSVVNTKYSELEVSGEDNSNYQVVIYPVINDISLNYIKYSITIDNNTYSDTLGNMPKSSDEGIIVYNSKVTEGQKITIRMWVSKDYDGEVENNSFKIKINPRQEK